MPVDKAGALLIVAQDEDSWLQVYRALNGRGRVVRHKELPKNPSRGFRFMAWSAGMAPNSTYLRKTSEILPENTWYDGTHLRYQESKPKFRWIGKGPARGGYDDDDDDDCSSKGSCCGDCCNVKCRIGWRENDAGGYFQDGYGNWYDPAGNYIPWPSQPCQPVNWAPQPAHPPPPHDRRGRRFAAMATPAGRDDDNFVWQEGPAGPVRYTRALANPICDETACRPFGANVEQYRCG